MGGTQCITENAVSIAKCFDTALTTYEFDGFLMSAKDCKFYSATSDCVAQTMKSAECAKPKTWIETSFKSAYDLSLCKGV